MRHERRHKELYEDFSHRFVFSNANVFTALQNSPEAVSLTLHLTQHCTCVPINTFLNVTEVTRQLESLAASVVLVEFEQGNDELLAALMYYALPLGILVSRRARSKGSNLYDVTWHTQSVHPQMVVSESTCLRDKGGCLRLVRNCSTAILPAVAEGLELTLGCETVVSVSYATSEKVCHSPLAFLLLGSGSFAVLGSEQAPSAAFVQPV